MKMNWSQVTFRTLRMQISNSWDKEEKGAFTQKAVKTVPDLYVNIYIHIAIWEDSGKGLSLKQKEFHFQTTVLCLAKESINNLYI